MFNKVLIRKSNLINNIKQVKLENPNSKICAMVKANAYGVGVNEVVQIIDDYVDFYGVACFFEANKLKNLTNKKILIVGPLQKGEINTSFSYTCSSLGDIEYLISQNKEINVHLKINTGMNRYGFKDLKTFKKAINLILTSKLHIEGVFTHYATTDDYVRTQTQIFNKYIKLVKSFKINPIIHADNSFVNEKFNHGYNMVRIGFSLYNRSDGWYLPAVEIKSEVVQTQEVKKNELVGYDYRFVAKNNTKIAIVPIGYADGFDMKYIGIDLIVKGKKCKVLNICMDCFMLDITNTDIKKGDEIYILNKFNTLKLYADYNLTSQYETMIKFSFIRAERVIV